MTFFPFKHIRNLSGCPNSSRFLRDARRWAGIAFLFLAVCGQTTSSAQDTRPAPERIEHILVLPAHNMSEIFGINVGLRGPLSGEVFVTAEAVSDGVAFIGTTFRDRLMRLENLELIQPKSDRDLSDVGLFPAQGTREQRLAEVRQAGRQTGADSVFCTYVYGFRKRVGTPYGVEVPAMIAFEAVLVSVASGRILWQESYSESQQPLNDDLLKIRQFIERKGRWITAEEMAVKTIDRMIQKISDLRQENS